MSGNDGGGSPQDRYYERYAQTTGSARGAAGPPSPERGPAQWWALGVLGLAVVLVVGVVVLFGALRSGSGPVSASSGAPSSTGTDPTSGSGTPTGQFNSSGVSPTTAAKGALQVRAVVPGWQPVGGLVTTKNQIYGAYDAPPGWTVQQDGFITFKDAGLLAIRSTTWGSSAYNVGKCPGKPNAAQATASFVDIGKRDPAEAINGVLDDFGSATSANKDKSTHAIRGEVTSKDVRIAGGSLPAVRGKLIVTQGTLNDDCGVGRQSTFSGVAFSTNGRSVMLLVTVAQWPGQTAPDAATIDKIIASLRPAGG